METVLRLHRANLVRRRTGRATIGVGRMAVDRRRLTRLREQLGSDPRKDTDARLDLQAICRGDEKMDHVMGSRGRYEGSRQQEEHLLNGRRRWPNPE